MGKGNLRRFKMDPRYPHKRSEGLRRVSNHPAARLIASPSRTHLPANAAMAETIAAKELAKGKCYHCGKGVVVVTEMAGRDAVLHEMPECKVFIEEDSDLFARRCNLTPVDPIAEEFAKLLDDES
jgi:hypothetical protein